MEFKDILRDLRLEYSLSQKDIAQECDLSPQCISQLEMGSRNPTGSTLLALAEYFDCSIDYLMGRVDSCEKTANIPQHKFLFDEDEKHLIDTYRKLNIKNRIHVSTYAELRLEEQQGSTGSRRV